MRVSLLALGLSLCFSGALAFEIEATRHYAAEEPVAELRILSTADIEVFHPIILAFQARFPDRDILYDVASSAEVMRAIYDEGVTYDLVISSAMDLQIKLANDGLIQPYDSPAVQGLPDWAQWRGEVFAFTSEPAVMVVSERAFEDFDIPQNRSALISLLREAPEAFRGRIGTYDARTSGLGYLFATQDARNTETFWPLTEIMGGLGTELYCCSGAMITDVAEGRLAFAYNVLGSYANARVAQTPGLRVVELEDYVSVMLRTVVIPKTAQNAEDAGAMIDFLLSDPARDILATVGLPPIPVEQDGSAPPRTIRLGPGLLVYLDQLRREAFLRNWSGSIAQE